MLAVFGEDPRITLTTKTLRAAWLDDAPVRMT
jgi:lipopolysaccharide/colanic/teichoic acid biosynthesis glycosyltransferase